MPRAFDPYRPEGLLAARRLRHDATVPECLLWSRLRRRALGVRVLRQHPVGPYVVDFFCPEARLAIEVDGRSHDGRGAADAARTAALERLGLAVVRVTNDDVLRDLDGTVARLAAVLATRLGRPLPPPA